MPVMGGGGIPTAPLKKLTYTSLIPDGGRPTRGVWLKVKPGGSYGPLVVGPPGPLGSATALNTEGRWLSLDANPDTLPLPAGRAGIILRAYLKPAPGHNWNVRVVPYNAAGGAINSGTVVLSHAVASTPVGTLDDHNVYEATFTDWHADAVAYNLQINLNFTNLTGQSSLAGVNVIPVYLAFADDRAMQSPPAASVFEAAAIGGELAKPGGYTLPTETDLPTTYFFLKPELGVAGDVYAFHATRDWAMLQRAQPMITALLALRDDRRTTPWADFRGIVRKSWSTDQFQPTPDGNMWGTRNVTATPPHPGVRVNFHLHTGLIVYPILLWCEAVLNAPTAPAALTTAANTYLAACLEALHDFDAQFATETHVTNTETNGGAGATSGKLLALEGRYFMAYDSAQPVASREGYSYLPGGVEVPINQDCAMVAALYVAYRLTRGLGSSPTAEATEFKNKADRIMRRFKRMLYSLDGYTGWRYQRGFTWMNTVWDTTTANAPYAMGWSAYTNSLNNSQRIGDDIGHATYVLRAVRECFQTSNVLTTDEVAGIARTLMSGYWASGNNQRRFYLDTTEPYSSGRSGVDNVPQTALLEWAPFCGFDRRIAGVLREWYDQGRINRPLTAGMLKAQGII